MANQFLGLSMFIMLLSFFIVLNSLSDFEVKKANPILNSLSMTFSVDKPEDQDAESDADEVTEAMRKGTTLDKVQGLFETEITGVEAKQNRLGTVMHLRLTYEDFEKQITTGQGAFIDTLVSLLDAKESGNMTKMHMMVNLTAAPAVALANNDAQLSQSTRSVARIASVLQDAGLQKKLLTTGLKGGDEGMIDLYFFRYEPFNPLVNKIKEGT